MSDDEMQPRDEMTRDGAGAPEPPMPAYNQEFFLKLARPRDGSAEARAEARQGWNAWRRNPANAAIEVTFEGVDFRAEENSWISFAGFEFGNRTDFSGAIFGDDAQFTRAAFGVWARFSGAKFGNEARFVSVTFELGASFAGSVFGNRAQFAGTTFAGSTVFSGATFGGGANFAGEAGERDVEVRQRAWASLEESERGRRERSYRKRREAIGIGPARFSGLSFAGAHFCGLVSFARRSFERPANFTDVRFDDPPDFDGATNLQRIDFTGARAAFASADYPWWKPDWTTNSRIAIRLRALRSQIEATKNHDFERDLYIEERKAERGIYFDRYRRERRWGALASHSLWIAVMAVYWALSDYGRSWLRPALCLGVVLVLFHGLGPVDGITARALGAKRGEIVAAAEAARPGSGGEVGAAWDEAAKLYAVANSIPFVGPLTIDGEVKKFLFCGPPPPAPAVGETAQRPCVPLPPASLQAATIVQNLLSILLVFFIGLALRNYFRLK